MTIEETLAERGARYGDFSDHACVAQEIQDAFRRQKKGWDKLTSDKKQALTVIADKIARILTGDPDYRDNWHDIQGYAKLAEDRCKDWARLLDPCAHGDGSRECRPVEENIVLEKKSQWTKEELAKREHWSKMIHPDHLRKK